MYAEAQPNSTGDAGDLTIKANSLLVKDGALVGAETFGAGKGGNLTVDAQDVQLIGRSKDGRVGSGLFASARSTGDAGNLKIKTNTLLVKDGALVAAGTSSTGNGGNLKVDAQDIQLIGTSKDGGVAGGLRTRAEPNSTGNAGDLTIKTNTLLVKDGSQVISATSSKGKAGNLMVEAQDVQLIGRGNNGNKFPSGLFASVESNSGRNAGELTIKTNTLLVKDGARVSAQTFGAGKGGNLTVNAQDVQLIGFGSGLYAQAGRSTGDAGELTITANTLLVKDGALVTAGTSSAGNGGNLKVDAQDIQLIGTSFDGDVASSLRTRAEPNSTGKAGDLTIKTNTLLVKDGADVVTSTRGKGKAGNLMVEAQDVQLIGRGKNVYQIPSALLARSGGDSTGDAGDLTITTNTLLVKDGALVAAGTFSAGNGGNLKVDAQDIQLIGTSKDGDLTSSLRTRAEPNSTGNAGDLTIKTNTLLVKDGAEVITSTNGKGKAGKLMVDAQGVQLIGRGKNGTNIPSGLLAQASSVSNGDAGNLTVKTNTLIVKDGARVSVRGLSTGSAGNLTINADSIRLNNNAEITANTQSPNTNPKHHKQQSTSTPKT